MEWKKETRWFGAVILLTAGILFCISGLTVWIDPFFHYHKPLEGFAYLLNNERYMNDGILKNFDYEAVITGTSMTENFMTSEFEELWGVKTIKVPFPGGTYKEINDSLARAFKNGKEIKYILRGLDYSALLRNKDEMRYEDSLYPWYLYDDFFWNDVKYVLNKNILINNTLAVIDRTKAGEQMTNFDEYSNWNKP